jgi:hypothetical protein
MAGTPEARRPALKTQLPDVDQRACSARRHQYFGDAAGCWHRFQAHVLNAGSQLMREWISWSVRPMS